MVPQGLVHVGELLAGALVENNDRSRLLLFPLSGQSDVFGNRGVEVILLAIQIPALEGVVLSGDGGLGSGVTVLHNLRIHNLGALGVEGHGVLVDFRLSGDGHVLGGHGLRNAHIPASKGITDLGGGGGSGDGSAIALGDLCIGLAITDEGDGVLIDLPNSIQGKYAIGFCSQVVNLLAACIFSLSCICSGSPTLEGIALTNERIVLQLAFHIIGKGRSGLILTVFQKTAVTIELNGVRIGLPLCSQSQVVCRHALSDLRCPTSEGVACSHG